MTTIGTTTKRSAKRADIDFVVRKMTDYISGLESGDRVPNHPELMSLFDASERSVLHALNTLQRSGRIVRRQGAGTFVAESTVEKVVPSSVDALAHSWSRTVVAVTHPDHSFFDRCVESLYRETEAENVELMCRVADPKMVDQSILPALPGKPLGIIVFRSDFEDLAVKLQAEGHRVVLIGAPKVIANCPVPNVFNSHEHGGYLSAQHLIELGHRSLAFQYNKFDNAQQSRDKGYMKAVREAERAGIKMRTSIILREQIDAWRIDQNLVLDFFNAPNAPTAIAAWNDHEAIEMLSVIQRAGIRVPEQLSIIGYDAMPEGTLVCPALTTIDQSIKLQLRLALDLITGSQAPKPGQSVVVIPVLVARQSTTSPPII